MISTSIVLSTLPSDCNSTNIVSHESIHTHAPAAALSPPKLLPLAPMSTLAVPPAVARSLATWHEMIASTDLSRLGSITHPHATFRSPMAVTPYESRDALLVALGAVITIFDDFTYHRTLASADGLSVVLEFSAAVGGKKIKGIDLIRFDEDGMITEFEVMVRPMSGLQALGKAMGERVGGTLPKFKGKL